MDAVNLCEEIPCSYLAKYPLEWCYSFSEFYGVQGNVDATTVLRWNECQTLLTVC